MQGLILEPLKFYTEYAKERHRANLNEHFDSLVERSGIDVEQNRATVRRYDNEMKKVEAAEKKLTKYRVLFGLLIALGVIGIILFIGGVGSIEDEVTIGTALIGTGMLFAVLGFVLAFTTVRKRAKNIEKIKATLDEAANKIRLQALGEMSALNGLFASRDTLTLIEKTMPEIKFDRTYTRARERELIEKYDYIDMTDDNTSVTDMLSGDLFGNPFLYERYTSEEMGTEVYHGTRTIFWTETYRDSDGRMRTRTRTQVLHASVVKPKPRYFKNTHLGYGADAAPDLSFTRAESDVDELSERALERRIRKGEKDLAKKAQKALEDGKDFQEMSNSEFEVLFGAKDRNHEVQWRVLYSPLAQVNTVDLLKSKDGYGDDFNFIKRGKFNIIKSKHAQIWNMDLSPVRYRTHSVDLSRKMFLEFNEEYFKSIFFDMAPLMSIPAYHTSPGDPFCDEKNAARPTAYVHEALANAIGDSAFVGPDAATDAILKTAIISENDDEARVRVSAYYFTAIPRTDLIPVMGGDRRLHTVPVPWLEYFPATNTRDMTVCKSEAAGAHIPKTKSAFMHGMFAFVD